MIAIIVITIAGIIAICSAVIGLGSVGFAQVVAVSALCCSLNVILLKLLNFAESRYIAYKFFVFFNIVQPFAFLSLAVQYPELTENMCQLTSLYRGGAFTLLYSFCLVPAVAVGLAVLFLLFRGDRENLNAIKYYQQVSDNRLNYLLFIGALINLLMWFETFIPSIIGYGVRVLHSTFGLSALLAGFYWNRSYLVRYGWLASLGIGVFFSVLTGSRGYAFWPLLYYTIGFLIQLKGLKKILAITAFLVILPVGFFFLGFIQNLRDEIGRKNLSEINLSEVINYIPVALKTSLEMGNKDQVQLEASTGYTGLQRLVDWTLLFAPNMTPDPIKYRGYGDYMLEIQGMFVFGGINLNKTVGTAYPSVLFTRNYGFGNVNQNVNAEGKLASFTVPFGVVADSWSRLGLVSSIFQVAAALLLFITLEGAGRRFLKNHPDIMIMGLTVLARYAMQFATVYSLTSTTRRTIVFWIFMLVVCYILKLIHSQLFPGFFQTAQNLKPLPFHVTSSKRPVNHGKISQKL